MKKLLSLALLGGVAWLAYGLASGARRRGLARQLGLGPLDLNHCSREDLLRLEGIDEETADRILDRRPYRNKLDLVSQMVLGRPQYELISSRITVIAPREAGVLTPSAEAIA